jgi:hypothetical protein
MDKHAGFLDAGVVDQAIRGLGPVNSSKGAFCTRWSDVVCQTKVLRCIVKVIHSMQH